MGHFCNADAIITPVGSCQIDRWMFLYEAYFVLLPTMYFQCPACGHRWFRLFKFRQGVRSGNGKREKLKKRGQTKSHKKKKEK